MMHRLFSLPAAVVLFTGCATPREPAAPLGEIYSQTAQTIGAERNPVVVIPGILGSRLVESDTNQIVWGAFTYGAADPDFAPGARLVALPMQEGVPLAQLRDNVVPDGVLETLDANVSVFKITAIEPYRGIIQALAAGRYVDRDIALGKAHALRPVDGPIDYAGLHSTCFQFDYDWRRDLAENAASLDRLIRAAAEAAATERGKSEPAKVDVVAHSMGGLVLMYYLRYGTQPLPEDGSRPTLTWAGAANVERAVLVGVPSAGSVLALRQLVEGANHSPITPTYQPAVLCTMPSLFELLPRDRHRRVVDGATGEPLGSLYDPATWERNNWGPFSPSQDEYLQWLLPEAPDAAARRCIAAEHLRKCLARAEQFHRAIDVPSVPPETLSLSLVLGDAVSTPSVLAVGTTGELSVIQAAPGDGTVTRSSALMDERLDGDWQPRLRSPIRWRSVQFIAADHIALTEHPAFIDGLLYSLLEEPR